MALMGVARPSLTWILLGSLFLTGLCHGETEETWADLPVIDTAHAYVSGHVSRTVGWFDRFLATERDEIEANDSTLRLIGGPQWVEKEGVRFVYRLRFRARLPRLSNRLSLVVSDIREEWLRDESAAEGARTEALRRDDIHIQDRSVAVEYLLREWAKARMDLDAGFRSGLEPQVVARFRQYVPMTPLWQGWFTVRGFWRGNVGYGETTHIDIERQWAPARVIFWNLQGTYSEESAGLEWFSGAGWRRRLSSTSALVWQGSLSGPTRPQAIVENVRAAVLYRRNVYRHWFFVDVEPAVDFPKGTPGNRPSVFSAAIRLDVLFRRTLSK